MTEQDKPAKQSLPPVGLSKLELMIRNKAAMEPAKMDETRATASIMGDEKALKKSTDKEEFGICPEAAGLEPKCDQPSPAQAPVSVEQLKTSEIRYNADVAKIIGRCVGVCVRLIVLEGKAEEHATKCIENLLQDLAPYLRPIEPEVTMHIADMTGKTHSFPVKPSAKDVLNKPDNLNTSGERVQSLNKSKCDHWWRRMGDRMICEDCGYEEDDLGGA